MKTKNKYDMTWRDAVVQFDFTQPVMEIGATQLRIDSAVERDALITYLSAYRFTDDSLSTPLPPSAFGSGGVVQRLQSQIDRLNKAQLNDLQLMINRLTALEKRQATIDPARIQALESKAENTERFKTNAGVERLRLDERGYEVNDRLSKAESDIVKVQNAVRKLLGRSKKR